MPPQDPESARWFELHLQPHEAMLRNWLCSRFGANGDMDDIIQEAYVRVLRAHETGVVQSPKAFLFTTARNLALNRLRHRHVEGAILLTETDLQGVIDEGADIREAIAHTQELELLTKAIQSLPKRCRQIFTLRKVFGMSQKEVAEDLGVSENTVKMQGRIGLRKVAEFFERYENKDRGAR